MSILLIPHLKLQKLIYFAQAAHLAINDEELFDEQIEAWPLGPVVRSVYDVFQDHGRDIIAAEHGSEDGIDDYAQSSSSRYGMSLGNTLHTSW
jgi:uncharacterized phage-associated protein